MSEFDAKVEAAIQRAADCATHEGRVMAVAYRRSIAQLARYSLAAWKAERAWTATRAVVGWIDPVKENQHFMAYMNAGLWSDVEYSSARRAFFDGVKQHRSLLQAARWPR